MNIQPTPFTDAQPTRYIYVDDSGSNSGDGSAGRPLRTIQAAVDMATPGTAIMVRAGTYVENVKLPSNGGGTATDPIWLVSADGVGAAKVVAASPQKSAIYGYGTDNYVVANFAVEGGKNGIQFSLSGTNFANTVQNIVVQGNIVNNSVEDGIKISQGINVHVLDNTVRGSGDQGIDFVAVNQSVIANNDVSGIKSYTAVFAKGGSSDVLIANNHIHDVVGDGIAVGGWTEPQYMWPGVRDYEARNVAVIGNIVEDVGKRAVNVLGAQGTVIADNYLEANPKYYSVINSGLGGPLLNPRPATEDTIVSNNTFSREKNLITTEAGNEAPLVTGSKVAAQAVIDAGPTGGAAFSFKLVGTAAADVLVGTRGSETIDGGRGDDSMAGGLGDDRYVVDSLRDLVIEKSGEGYDTVELHAQFHRLADNVEAVEVKFGAGAIVFGNSRDNHLVGGDGDDVLSGGRGADLLTGGRGADRFLFEVGDGKDTVTDFVSGTDSIALRMPAIGSFAELYGLMSQVGKDTVITFSSSQTLTLLGVAKDSLSDSDFEFIAAAPVSLARAARLAVSQPDPLQLEESAKFKQKIMGTGDADHIAGSSGHDFIDGGSGTDVMAGGAGDDTYVVNSKQDRILEKAGEGIDTVHVYDSGYVLDNFVENMEIKRNTGLTVDGNAMGNIIKGGAGNDVIAGNGGRDLIYGGKGADSFVYRDLYDAGDRIADFELGVDRVDLTELFKSSPAIKVSLAQTESGVDVIAQLGGQATVLASLDKVHKVGLQLSDLTL